MNFDKIDDYKKGMSEHSKNLAGHLFDDLYEGAKNDGVFSGMAFHMKARSNYDFMFSKISDSKLNKTISEFANANESKNPNELKRELYDYCKFVQDHPTTGFSGLHFAEKALVGLGSVAMGSLATLGALGKEGRTELGNGIRSIDFSPITNMVDSLANSAKETISSLATQSPIEALKSGIESSASMVNSAYTSVAEVAKNLVNFEINVISDVASSVMSSASSAISSVSSLDSASLVTGVAVTGIALLAANAVKALKGAEDDIGLEGSSGIDCNIKRNTM